MPEVRKQEKGSGKEIQLVIFRLAGEEFGLDISQVREIVRLQDITPMPKAPEFIRGVTNLRGQIIAVMDLAKRFGLKEAADGEKTRIVICEIRNNAVGLIVDEVPEVIRISSENIEPTPQMLETQIHTDFIKGVGKLEGRLVIILDADKILSPQEAETLKAQKEAGGAEK